MTSRIRGGFRRILIIGAALPAVAGLALGLTAASASAATTAPAHHQRCDEILTYQQEGFFGGGRLVIVRDVCPGVEVFRARHHTENLFYQTERFGFLQDHFARDVRDVRVF